MMTDSVKPNILKILQCPVCHDSVKNTFLCPICSQHFCQNCIWTWLGSNSKTCPHCRAGLSIDQLIKCPRFDELQEIIQQDHPAAAARFCQQHSKQQVTLFCNQCETCICVSCYFSESKHTQHRDRIVPLETAFEHKKKILGESLIWIHKRIMEVDRSLHNVQENGKYLQELKDNILRQCNLSRKLISGEPDAHTLLEIMGAEKAVNEFRSHFTTRKLQILNDCEDIYMSDTIKLIFRFSKIHSNHQKQCVQKTVLVKSDSKWICEMERTETEFKYYLTLSCGKPRKIGVAIENQYEQFLFLQPGKPVELEVSNVTADIRNGTHELVINLRQTYKERCQQLQVYNEQLEKEKSQIEEQLEDYSKQLSKEKSQNEFLWKCLYTTVPVSLGLIFYWFWRKCPVRINLRRV